LPSEPHFIGAHINGLRPFRVTPARSSTFIVSSGSLLRGNPHIDRVLFDKEVVETIEESCRELGFKCKKTWSWAGHDAQNMAKISKTGMIFIPSVNGKSHSKEEYSRDEDLARGLLVLLNTILALDKI
jgi:acetylornithine deacetylase/succinyl-diaminopimelate desuccinylase-like protein